MKTRISNLTIIILLIGMISTTSAEPTKGIFKLSLLGGFAKPIGDIASQKYYGAKSGSAFGFGLEFYPINKVGVGIYMANQDFAAESMVIQNTQIPLRSLMVCKAGVMFKYFFYEKTQMQPYIKAEIGVSTVIFETPINIATSSGEFDPDFGAGLGFMIVPTRIVTFSADLTFNKGDVHGLNQNSNRFELRAGLNVGY